jgi:hypothetical protein
LGKVEVKRSIGKERNRETEELKYRTNKSMYSTSKREFDAVFKGDLYTAGF